MLGAFDRDGVQFQFPDSWKLSEDDDTDNGWTVTIEGPTVAFMIVSYAPDTDDPNDIINAALDGLQEEYKDLESDEVVDTLANQPAIGFDVNFAQFDLNVTSWIRAIPCGTGSLLVLTQCCDDELPFAGETLKAIMASFRISDD